MKSKSIKTFLFLGVFLVGFLFLLTRCQKNNIAKKTNENYIEKAKAWFDAHPKMNQFTVLSFSEKPDWGKAFYHKNGDKVAVEIPVKLKKGMAVMIHDTVNQNVINRIVFVIDKENTVKSFYELIKPDNTHIETPEKINYFNVPADFSGTIMITNKNTGVKQYRQYVQGKPYHFKSEGKLIYYDCWRIVQVYSDGSYEPVTDWICDVTYGGGGDSGGHDGGGSSNGKGTGGKTSKPCPGNPVKNPEIVSSGTSGKRGGTFGCVRKDKDEKCGGVKGLKGHEGLDLKATPNSDVYSMYDGKVVNLRNSFAPGTYKKDSKGNFVLVRYQEKGETFYVQYNHLNKVSVTKGQLVKTGDILGLSGTTGNVTKKITPHVHIEVYNNKWKLVNPMDYITTKFDANYNAITNSNCN